MTGSLFLSPQDPWQTPPAREAVLATLADLRVIAEPHGTDTWLAGDALLRHVTFAGCSPYLEMTPPADGSKNFCHLALLGPFDQPRLFTGPNTLKPRCPNCKTRFADWQPLAVQYQSDPAQAWACPACGSARRIDALRWRQHAAFGRLLVEIRSVFPAEGIPSDELVEALGQLTDGVDWQFAWAASSA